MKSANESKTEIDDDESETDWALITKKSSVPSLVSQLKLNELKANSYDANDWRFFIDYSKQSIRAALLHNTNSNFFSPLTIIQENMKIWECFFKK